MAYERAEIHMTADNNMISRSIRLKASADLLDEVTDWMDELLLSCGCDREKKIDLDISVEEIFINIASYAYEEEGSGEVRVTLNITPKPRMARITFEDRGVPFDPLKQQTPDMTLPAKERSAGGLGIHLAKEHTDEMSYEYRDGKNILTLVKYL